MTKGSRIIQSYLCNFEKHMDDLQHNDLQKCYNIDLEWHWRKKFSEEIFIGTNIRSIKINLKIPVAENKNTRQITNVKYTDFRH